MDRPQKPFWPWRALAFTMLIVIGLLALPSLLAVGPVGWLFSLVNWIAIAGTFAYAYGRRPRPLWFWRGFALLFSLYAMASLGRLLGRFATTFFQAPTWPSLAIWTTVTTTLALYSLVSVALLRHAELLRARQRQLTKMYEKIFA